MSIILILIVIFAVSLFLIMIGAIWSMNFFSKKYIGEKHIVLEELTNGEIPKLWSDRFKEKCKKLQQKGQYEKIAQLKKEANATYLKRLNNIVEYIKKTKLVDSEETRKMILADLEKTRTKWRDGNSHGA